MKQRMEMSRRPAEKRAGNERWRSEGAGWSGATGAGGLANLDQRRRTPFLLSASLQARLPRSARRAW